MTEKKSPPPPLPAGPWLDPLANPPPIVRVGRPRWQPEPKNLPNVLWKDIPGWAFVAGALVILVIVAGIAASQGVLGNLVGIVSWFCVVILLYFVPSIVAGTRGHRNYQAILILNIFLGWTFVGWVVALVWAVLDQDRRGF